MYPFLILNGFDKYELILKNKNVAELSHPLLALQIKDGFKSTLRRVQKGTLFKFVNMLIHSDEEHLCMKDLF